MRSTTLYLGLLCWLIGAVLGLFLCENLRGDETVRVIRGNAEIAELRVGVRYYSDRDYTITELPDEIRGYLIRTRNADKGQMLSTIKLRLSENCVVYVLYDSRATSLPYWLEQYDKSLARVTVSDARMKFFNVYEHAFAAGDVELGANFAEPAAGIGAMYCAVVRPVNWGRKPFNWRTEVDHWELRFVRITREREDAVRVFSGRQIKVSWQPGTTRLSPDESAEDPPLADATDEMVVASVLPREVTGEASTTITVSLRPGTWGLSIACIDTLGLRSPGSDWVFLNVARLGEKPGAAVKVTIVVE